MPVTEGSQTASMKLEVKFNCFNIHKSFT